MIRVNRDINHQGTSDILLAVAKERRPHSAAAAVRADQDGRLKRAASGRDAHAAAVLRNFLHAGFLDQFDPGIAGGPGQPRIELITPNDRAQRLSGLAEIDRSKFSACDPSKYFDRRYVKFQTEFCQRGHGPRNQTAGANFEARMARLIDRGNSSSKMGPRAHQIERCGEAGRPRASDEHVVLAGRIHW